MGCARTQAQLCELTGQNSSTISELLRRLRKRGLVETVGVRRNGRGRPATILRFNPGGYVVGIDLDGAHALVGILDFRAQVLASKLIGFEPHVVSAEEVLDECHDAIRDLLKQSKTPRSDVRGLGVSVNGQVSAAGVLEFSTVLPWRDVAIGALARSRFSLPTFVSDRRQTAVAEYRYGVGHGSRCMLYFNVADGVSARPVVDGELFTGGAGNAGQIGHIVVRPGGPLCGCGQQGCLEALISGPAICYRIVQDAKSNRAEQDANPPPSLLDPASRHAAVATIEELVRLAETGECRYAKKLLSEVLDLAGQGLAIAVACYGPDLIVIDGYVFRCRPELIRQLVERAQTRLGSPAVRFPQVVSGQLGGAARLVSLVAVVADGLVQSGAVVG
jgi:glucokinase